MELEELDAELEEELETDELELDSEELEDDAAPAVVTAFDTKVNPRS